MRRILTLSLFAVLISACSSSLQYGPRTVVLRKATGVPVYRRTVDNVPGDSIGVLPCCDTITAGARIPSQISAVKYLIAFGSDSGFVITPDAMEDWMAQSTAFTVPISQDKDAWARANYYLNNHSGLKIQNSNEFLIETYNEVPGVVGTSYSVNRLPQSDRVLYTVKSTNENSGKRCAYYVATGKEPGLYR